MCLCGFGSCCGVSGDDVSIGGGSGGGVSCCSGNLVARESIELIRFHLFFARSFFFSTLLFFNF